MNVRHTPARAAAASLLFALAAASTAAQQSADPAAAQPQSALPATPQTPAQATTPAVVRHRTPRPAQPAVTNPNLILLDPGHGAADNGAAFPNGTFEKDINIALANRLRTALSAQGFNVVMTHENAADDVPLDARVELSNRTHPLACVLLHATSAGHGMHLYTSSLQPRVALTPTSTDPSDQPIQPWDTAQAAALPQSVRLLSDFNSALSSLRLPLVTGHASVRPIDSMNCAAVMIEIAPLGGNGNDSSGSGFTAVSDAGYQQRVADSLAQALVLWRGHWQTPAMAQAQAAMAAQKPAASQKSSAMPRPSTLPQAPRPAQPQSLPSRTPSQKPDVTSTPATSVPGPRSPAPIIRATPATASPSTPPASPVQTPKPQSKPQTRTQPAPRTPIVDPDSMIVGDPVPVTRRPPQVRP